MWKCVNGKKSIKSEAKLNKSDKVKQLCSCRAATPPFVMAVDDFWLYITINLEEEEQTTGKRLKNDFLVLFVVASF